MCWKNYINALIVEVAIGMSASYLINDCVCDNHAGVMSLNSPGGSTLGPGSAQPPFRCTERNSPSSTASVPTSQFDVAL